MTAIVSYIAKIHNRAVVKIIGTAENDTATIKLTDLCVIGQTCLNPQVAISQVAFSLAADSQATVSRNNVVGISGYSGYVVSGYSGDSGFLYISGYSGVSGYSGYSSYSGVSGYSGQSGWTGTAGDVIYMLFGTDVLPYGSSESNTKDIVVTFSGSPGGTIILELSKTAGYSAMLPPGYPN